MRIFALMTAVVLLTNSLLGAVDADADIRDILATQADAWNKGNVEQFMVPYADNCTFMGKELVRSRDQLLARYKRVYPTSAAMGKLVFSDVEVKEIGQNIAIATGKWHITRSAKDGGDAGGYFSLVLKDIDDDWRIILDHTTAAQ